MTLCGSTALCAIQSEQTLLFGSGPRAGWTCVARVLRVVCALEGSAVSEEPEL